MSELKRTPLYEEHLAAEGKMIDFGGWEMPVQYTGVIEEHNTVRTKAGLFDVSHMGEIMVTGPEALRFVQRIIANDVSRLDDKQILYSPMCYPDGGIVDDLLVYRFGPEYFFIVVNASNTDKDHDWMQEQAKGLDVTLLNVSAQTAQLALQGPAAEAILQRLTELDLSLIKYYGFEQGVVADVPCLISRTGYTGEDGFELYFAPEHAPQLWRKILQSGHPEGIQPIGLGARDTLRFEACLPLYGNELGPGISPLEAGLGIFVKLSKEEFIGRDALIEQKSSGIPRQLVGMEMVERGIARSHFPIEKDGQEIGFVTSGSFSPTLNKNVALGLVRSEFAIQGDTLDVIIRGKSVKARIVPSLFYKRSKK